MRHFTKRLAAVLALLLLAAGASAVLAGSTLTGTIRGTVVDENGQPMPGVTVIFRSDALIREQARVTDADGAYFMAGLPPGNYAVVAQLAGYQTIQQTTDVLLDKTTRVDFVMVPGELTETVNVTATKPVVDKTNTEGSLSLDKDFTEGLPVPRQYQSLLTFAPGVTGGANPNMLGGAANSNVYQLDGVSITDPVTGTFGSNVNYDIIEAVDVKLTGVSAEYGGFQGGLSNVISKSGGNDFTGSLRDEIDSPSFDATYKDSTRNDFATERFREDVPVYSPTTDNPCFGPDPNGPPDGPPDPVNGRVLTANGPECWIYGRPSIPSAARKNLAHDVQGTFGGPIVRDSAWFFVSYTRNDNARVVPLGNPTGGPEGNGTYIRSFQGDNSSAKLTWQVVNNHKIQYTYFEDPANVPVCYYGTFFGGGCYDTNAVDFQNQGGHAWTGSWNGVWGNRVLTDLKYSNWQNGFNIAPFGPQLDTPDLIFPGNLGSGPAAGLGAYVDLASGYGFDAPVFASVPEVRAREQYEAKSTIFFDTGLGSHTLKIGADYQEQTRTGASVISGNALIYGQNWVDPPPGLGGNGDAYDINNRVYRFWYDFAEPGGSGSTTKVTSLYVQDDWQLNGNFTFNLGVRFDNNVDENDVGEKIFDQTGISPRLGASWDVTGAGKHVVKATASRYLDAIDLTTLSIFTRAAGGQSAYDLYFNTNFPNPGTPDWALIFQSRPDPDTNTFASGLKPQHIDEYTLSYEYALSTTMGVMVKGVNREWGDIVGQSYTWDYSQGAARKILLLDNRSYLKRKYNAVQLQFEKRFSNNWNLLANYTYGEAKGNVGGAAADQGFASYGAYPDVPQSVSSLAYGKLPWSIDNSGNIFGAYRIPIPSKRHSLEVGGVFTYRDGNRYEKSETRPIVVGPGPDGVQDNPLGTSGDGVTNDQTDQITQYVEERGTRQEPTT